MANETFKIRSADGITELEDISHCLKNLYSTRAGSIPLNRDFGLSWSALDQSTPDCQSDFALEVIAKTDKYEPRVLVTEVTFETDGDGRVVPTIHIEKGGTE